MRGSASTFIRSIIVLKTTSSSRDSGSGLERKPVHDSIQYSPGVLSKKGETGILGHGLGFNLPNQTLPFYVLDLTQPEKSALIAFMKAL